MSCHSNSYVNYKHMNMDDVMLDFDEILVYGIVVILRKYFLWNYIKALMEKN